MYINEYDDDSFETVAKVLWAINPSVKERYASVEELTSAMKFQTGCTLTKAGFWGTSGFYVSVCRKGDDSGWYAMASLAGHMVESFLERIPQKMTLGEAMKLDKKIPSTVTIWNTGRAYDRDNAQYIIAELYCEKNTKFVRFLDMSRNIDGFFAAHNTDSVSNFIGMQKYVLEMYDNGCYEPLLADEREGLWWKAPIFLDYLFPNWLIEERK